jgi:hypothetical protein
MASRMGGNTRSAQCAKNWGVRPWQDSVRALLGLGAPLRPSGEEASAESGILTGKNRPMSRHPALGSPFSEADFRHAIEHKSERNPKLVILNASLYPDERQCTASAAFS